MNDDDDDDDDNNEDGRLEVDNVDNDLIMVDRLLWMKDLAR